MRTSRLLVLSLPILGAVLCGPERQSAACGGCFHESESTQVSGHRMVLSISQTSSTLWDQVSYTGDPQSFAWVLPIHGQVDVGLSSDALFQVLDQTTQVTINSPGVSCSAGSGGSFNGGGAGGGDGGGVTIIDQKVVGPYETVQLAAQDPQALNDWLAGHGYVIPASIQPVIDAYVGEGFGFLALKLVPGQDVSSMKPVRVTTPGASPVLPLRMVAAGTGVATPVNLWVLGEGRYEPQNFPTFTIDQGELVWDWDSQSSNYSQLRDKGFADSDGSGWLVDYASKVSPFDIMSPLQEQGLEQYADEDGMNAQANLDAELDALYGGIAMNDLWISHLVAKLSQPALANDLVLQAAASQTPISPYLQATKETGAGPCGPVGAGGSGGNGNNGGDNAGGGNNASGGNSASGGNGGNGGGGKGSCDCTAAGKGGGSGWAALGLGLVAALAMARRKRRSAG